MNARLRMYKYMYCYSNEGAIYAKGLIDASRKITFAMNSLV